MGVPQHTRLRFVNSKDPKDLEEFLQALDFRVSIYSIVFEKGKWWCWYVPKDDIDIDVKSGSID